MGNYLTCAILSGASQRGCCGTSGSIHWLRIASSIRDSRGQDGGVPFSMPSPLSTYRRHSNWQIARGPILIPSMIWTPPTIKGDRFEALSARHVLPYSPMSLSLTL